MYYKHEEILYQKILRFQKKHKLSYRYSINNLAKDLNIKVVSYPTFDYNALNAISEDGFSVYENNKYYIFYNPFIIETRLNFTIAHEIGHIVLNHHKLVGKNILASGESGLIERHG